MGCHPQTPLQSPIYINGRQACLLLDCSPSVLLRLALFGHIRYEIHQGTPRYLRVDVTRYAAECKEAKKHRNIKARKKTTDRGNSLQASPVSGAHEKEALCVTR